MVNLPFLSSLAFVTGLASAQCAFSSISVTSYGQGCNQAIAGQPVTLAGELDANNCWLTITVGAAPSAGNVFLQGRILVLGLQPLQPIPLPQIGPGCMLLASVDLALFQGQMNPTGQFILPLPSAPLPQITLYAQGVALYQTLIPFVGYTDGATLSAGAQIDLQ